MTKAFQVGNNQVKERVKIKGHLAEGYTLRVVLHGTPHLHTQSLAEDQRPTVARFLCVCWDGHATTGGSYMKDDSGWRQ